MQHYMVHKEDQTCVLQEDMQQFKEEISTLRSLAEEAGVTDHVLEELDVFKHEIDNLDARAWERKEVRVLNRDELVHLSLAVLRAFGSRSW